MRYIKFIILITCLFTISCSTDESLGSEESVEDPNSWRIIDITGRWHLDYILETNHNGIHVGTEKRLKSTEYNYIEYEFKNDGSFIKTTVEGSSSEDIEQKTETGEYLAHYPENKDGKWLELQFEDGDFIQRRMDINNWKTQLIIDLGSTTINCNCSDPIYDYEQFYDIVE